MPTFLSVILSHFILVSLPSSGPFSGPFRPPFCYQMLCDLGTVWEPPHDGMLRFQQPAAEDVLVGGPINRQGFCTQSWGDRQRLWERGAWPLENTIKKKGKKKKISLTPAKLTLAPHCAWTCRSFIFLDSTNWASEGEEGLVLGLRWEQRQSGVTVGGNAKKNNNLGMLCQQVYLSFFTLFLCSSYLVLFYPVQAIQAV